MDQVTAMEVLVAADRPAGWPIQAGKPVHLVADQHPMHGGGRELHAGGDAGRAEPLASAQPEDALLEPSGGPPGAVGGDAGPVDQAGLAELLVAAPPAVGEMPISWAMWAVGRRGWAAIRPTRVSLPAGSAGR
jgi:hypothetical protein